MELTELATKETAALIGRVERDIADLTGRLAIAAAADRDAAVERVAAEARAAAEVLRAEIAGRTADLATVTASLADAHTDVAQLRADAEDLRGALRKAEGLTEAAQRELKTAQGELKTAHGELKTAQTELKTAHGELKTAQAELKTSQGGLKAAQDQVSAFQRELAEARSRYAQLQAERSEAVAARDKETAARTLAETGLQDLREVILEHERARLEIEARLEAAADRDNVASALLDGLLNGFTTLGTATTIPDILTTLVEQLAAEFPRIALFRPKGNRLEGQHQIGFDLKTDITKVVMPLGLDSLPSRAAASGHIESLSGPDVATGNTAPFGGSPTCAIALPVVVQGETLAVVYADDWGNDRQDTPAERAARIKYCDAMLQHAVALLMRLTNELKTMAELRAYAASLLNEIQQMYVADVTAEKTGDDLRRRLQANIEYARSIFATRVALECPEAGPLIEDEIASAIEREEGSPFGRDLEKVAGSRAQEKRRA